MINLQREFGRVKIVVELIREAELFLLEHPPQQIIRAHLSSANTASNAAVRCQKRRLQAHLTCSPLVQNTMLYYFWARMLIAARVEHQFLNTTVITQNILVLLLYFFEPATPS